MWTSPLFAYFVVGVSGMELPATLSRNSRGSNGARHWAPTPNQFQLLGEVWVKRRGLRLLRPLTPRRQWLRGSDLNRRPLGYEPSHRRHSTRRKPNTPDTSSLRSHSNVGGPWAHLELVRVLREPA